MSRPLNILSIQSHVAYGHVGNASAVFPMQRLGCEVWPIHTVQFSNHTGYQEGWTGRVFDGAMIDEIVEGIARLGKLGECDGVLSGYMGSADIGQAILSAVGRVRSARPGAIYCCDPVIGDVGRGIFVRPGVPEFFRERAVPAADIITPNQFELNYLAGFETPTMAEVRRALAVVHALGPKVILATSVLTEATPADSIDLIASGDGGIWRLRTPLLKLNVNGAGDAIAALFLVHWLRSGSLAESLSLAASSLFGVLQQTVAAGSRELLTIAAQEEFIRPSLRLSPERI
ncbi:MAG: pyridoxal kinase PdxY [Methylocystis sp.]|nr:pyridoxal kinase PdxY [Methylocystis sp.]MCA3584391.1 pyridoxal kinase PdxY [Methylocystis sp.]MCA3587973.1 pyridoxal kinase PdxY [Methylocystis sp.]MCA3592588.1 pyridoxal kinase PdxY [Methylocystis sp.]